MKETVPQWFDTWYNGFREKGHDETTILYFLARSGYDYNLIDSEDQKVDSWLTKVKAVGKGDYRLGKLTLMKAILNGYEVEEVFYLAKMYYQYISFIPERIVGSAVASKLTMAQWEEVGITETDAIFETVE